MAEPTLLLAFFGAFFAVTNPFGNIALFIAYTRELRTGVQRASAVLLTIFLIAFLTIFYFVGDDILKFFGITIPAFQIAGGIIIFGIGLSMISGFHSETLKKEFKVAKSDGKETLEEDFQEAESFIPKILVPLGVPIYAGPGALSVVIVYGNKAILAGDSVFLGGILVIFAGCLIICGVNLLASPIKRIIGEQGLEILVRIMGLFLAAIAVVIFLEGLTAVSTVFHMA